MFLFDEQRERDAFPPEPVFRRVAVERANRQLAVTPSDFAARVLAAVCERVPNAPHQFVAKRQQKVAFSMPPQTVAVGEVVPPRYAHKPQKAKLFERGAPAQLFVEPLKLAPRLPHAPPPLERVAR